MTTYTISHTGYCKLLLHALKFPHASVSGALLGRKSGDSVEITDVLPMFHSQAGASLLRAAFMQAEAHAQQNDCEICGYYHANERENDRELSPLTKEVGSKVHANFEKACVLLVDNAKISALGADTPALYCFTKENNAGNWARSEIASVISFQDAARTSRGLQHMFDEHVHYRLADFELHLEDIATKNWLNPDLITE